MPDADPDLLAALALAVRQGAIGERSLESAVRHSEQFLAPLPSATRHVVDLGSGGGLPGVVIAVRRPDLVVRLVERRASRADVLRRIVSRLGIDDRVTVSQVDATLLGHDSAWSGWADVVTARSFASPIETVSIARPLLADGGLLVVSAPPASDRRWDLVGTDWIQSSGYPGVVILRRG